jgi:hypothetical protein
MNTQSSIIKLCLMVSIFVCILAFFPKNAWADGPSLKVSPSTLQIQAKPPADIWAPFTIENQSSQPIQLQIGYKPFNPLDSQNGNVTFLQDEQTVSGRDKKIFQKIQVIDDNNISRDTISLGPKQREHLRLRITLPVGEPTDDYYFSLIFLEKSNQSNQKASKDSKKSQESYSNIQTGIGINVLLAIGEIETPQITIGNFTTAFFRDAGPVPFSLTIYNDGRHFVTPHGEIQIKNMFGQTVGEISLPSSVVLAGTGRTYTGNNADTFANNFWGLEDNSTSNQLVWQEHFLLGTYTATLYLSSNNRPLYSKTINFFAFPLKPTLIILLVLFVILIIVHRVKIKLSK